MRTEAETSIGVRNISDRSNHIQTIYSNKIISVELRDQIDQNILNCSFQNGKVKPVEAILERAINGYNFEKIESLKDYDPARFQFEDTNKQEGSRYNYRLLIKEKNGVTYYSEIISCNS